VLTFRNVHNWMKGEYEDEVFAAMYKALKPKGILGMVEHRANEGTSLEAMIKSGYVTEAHVIALAEKAGFKLLDRSEVNANAKDTKDHPEGVWTLPPSLRLKEHDKEKYLAIGESDRMTLKFVKPK
jgi:predicted methyltransferase